LYYFPCFAVLVLFLPQCARYAAAPGAFTPTAPPPPTESQPQSVFALTDTETLLACAQISPLDPYDLARRLKHIAGPFPQATPLSPITYSLGDRETFWLLNLDPVESFQISATLRHISPHLYMWVQDDIHVQGDALQWSAQTFEERLYPTVRRCFGSEWSPGIDRDVRLTILNARFSGADGYFSSSDEYPSSVVPHSNQRELFYINPERLQPGSMLYDATLAHEFQHMIHWFADANEDAWVNEGASELAMHLCGYPRDNRISAFAKSPDTQLTSWGSPPDSVMAHYGAAFLFLAYFAERFGPQMTHELVAHELNGAAGFTSVLQAHKIDLSFEDLFADWVIANYLDGESGTVVGDPYGYQELDVQVKTERVVSSYPAKGEGTVHQYAADYIELEPAGHDVRLDFTGVATTRLVPNQAHSGHYQWWSNRGDNSDMTLTRSFDLSGLKKATLQAWLWYDIEEGWDYAYVEASADGGETWHILPGKYTTTDNPSGNSYGSGYTGMSGTDSTASGSAEWIQENLDLSPFAGHQVLIRFEYLTDEAVNRAGLCVDDIRIPELGYYYDAEEGEGAWAAQGFIRCNNTLRQRYIVQLIRIADEVTVERLPLRHVPTSLGRGEDQRGTLTIRGFDQSTRKAVLVISAVTPGSSEVASYHYEIRPIE